MLPVKSDATTNLVLNQELTVVTAGRAVPAELQHIFYYNICFL